MPHLSFTTAHLLVRTRETHPVYLEELLEPSPTQPAARPASALRR